MDMDCRGREVADASRMVEVQVGGHDMTHIARAVTQVHDLPQCGLCDFEKRPHRKVEQMSEAPRLVDILDAEAGVDQNQPIIALDQQAVAAHPGWRQQPA